jgi:thiamine biosynthesis protein ThiS
MIGITVNGERLERPEGITIAGLLGSLDLDTGRVAVEVDGVIVRQPAWQETTLPAGAQVEIVQFVGGG